jgi:hypothetical protein
VCSQLSVAFVVEPFHSGILERAVHRLNLTAPLENDAPDHFLILMGPQFVGLGRALLNPAGLTDHLEAHWSGIICVAVPGLLGELNAIIGENRVDQVGHGFERLLQELPSSLSISRFKELGDRDLGCPVDANEKI